MKSIYKYPLKITDIQTIEMPNNSKILTVQMQSGTPCLWVLVDDNQTNLIDRREILVIGTGHEFVSVGDYIGTFQVATCVFHVFEEDKANGK
jgi:hypothetical protein